jgi:hypothetical protein
MHLPFPFDKQPVLKWLVHTAAIPPKAGFQNEGAQTGPLRIQDGGWKGWKGSF